MKIPNANMLRNGKNDYVQQVESQRYAISLYGSETMEGEMVECNKIIKKV